ncbi:MAG: ATP-grasp fold amidoligase family protein [Solibacillus sp.]
MSLLMKDFKFFIKKCLQKTSPVLSTRYLYFKLLRKSLNLKDPKGFNEKIQWLKFNYKHPLIVQGADKYRMREYVSMLGLEHLLPKIHGVWEESSQIDWETLPEKFAMKCNHGCCYNIICTDKNQLDKDQAGLQLNKWLVTDYSYNLCELHYSKIKPLIICEEFLESKNQILPDDYKFYCFNGQPKVIIVCAEREPNKLDIRREFYDLDWNVLDIGDKPNEQKTKKPDSLNEMIEYATILAASFPFVRVDFYEVNSKPVLGELTFTPGAGLATFHSEEGDRYLGELLTLPPKYEGDYDSHSEPFPKSIKPLT